MNPLAMTHKRSTPLLIALLTAIWLLLASHPAYANTITVTTNDDTRGDNTTCTLRAAIQAANTNQPSAGCPAGDPGPDTILFTTPGTITLTAGQLTISESLTIDAATTSITLNGNSADRHFTILAPAQVLLKGLTLTNGLASTGKDGGAVHNSGHLTLDGCLLADNQAGAGSTTIANGSGGGIYNSGWLTITHSTLRHNRTGAPTANVGSELAESLSLDDLLNLEAEETEASQPTSLDDGEGGGIYNLGELWLSQSQLLDNQAETSGGGLFLQSGNGRIHNVLLAGNHAATDGEAITIAVAGRAEIIHNTIVAAILATQAALSIDGQAAITNSIIAHYAVAIASNDTAQVSEDYNLFFANDLDRVNLLAGAHSLQGDPGFVDGVNGDFHLTQASLAVNMGLLIAGMIEDLAGNQRPQQQVADIGAYESAYSWPQLTLDDFSQPEGNENITTVTLPVSLSFAKPVTISVAYRSNDDTATSVDHDYATTSGTLTFAPLQTTQFITIAVTGDTILENTEQFSVQLSDAVNATLSKASAMVTLLNDDSPAATPEPEKANPLKPRAWLPFVSR